MRDQRAREVHLRRLEDSGLRAPHIEHLVCSFAGELAHVFGTWSVIDARGAWRLASPKDVRVLVRRAAKHLEDEYRPAYARLCRTLHSFEGDAGVAARLLDLSSLLQSGEHYAGLLTFGCDGQIGVRFLPMDRLSGFLGGIYDEGGHITKLAPDGREEVFHPACTARGGDA